MFKEMLLATTALLAITSVTSSEARDSASANRVAAQQLALAVAQRGQDKNTEFLCAYGSVDVSAGYYASSEYQASRWRHVAVPIRGHGRAVATIVVRDGRSSPYHMKHFDVGIYSDSPSGTPGGLIVGASSRTNQQCRRIEIPIPKTVLRDGKKYWVVETVPRPAQSGYRGRRNSVTWGIDPVARDDAYSQYHTYAYAYPSGSTSYTSPWTPIKGRAPFVRVK